MSQTVRPTRYKELGYYPQDRGLWRIVDRSDGDSQPPRVIGPHYKTRAELLADLDRYAKEFGAEGAV